MTTPHADERTTLRRQAREWQGLLPDWCFLLALVGVAGSAPIWAQQLTWIERPGVNWSHALALAGGALLVLVSWHRFLPRTRAASLAWLALANALVWVPFSLVLAAWRPTLADEWTPVLLGVPGASLAATLVAWIGWQAWGPGRRA